MVRAPFVLLAVLAGVYVGWEARDIVEPPGLPPCEPLCAEWFGIDDPVIVDANRGLCLCMRPGGQYLATIPRAWMD